MAEFEEELNQLDATLEQLDSTESQINPLELIPDILRHVVSTKINVLIMRRELNSMRSANAARDETQSSRDSQSLFHNESGASSSSSTSSSSVTEKMTEYTKFQKDGNEVKVFVPKYVAMDLDSCTNLQGFVRKALQYYHPIEYLASVTLTGNTRILRDGNKAGILSPETVENVTALCNEKFKDKSKYKGYTEDKVRPKITKVLSEILGEDNKNKRKSETTNDDSSSTKRSAADLSQDNAIIFNSRYHSTQKENVLSQEDY